MIWTPDQDRKIKYLTLVRNMPARRVALALGFTTAQVTGRLQRLGVHRIERDSRLNKNGELNKAEKFTPKITIKYNKNTKRWYFRAITVNYRLISDVSDGALTREDAFARACERLDNFVEG